MSVNKTSTGYIVRYREGGRNKGKRFNTKRLGGKREAERVAKQFDAWQRERRYRGEAVLRRQDSPVLRDFAARFMANKPNLTRKTEGHYLQLLTTHVVPQLGGYRLSEITLEHLQDWQRARLEHSGPYAVKQAGDLLSAVLTSAVAHRLIDHNPAMHLERPRLRKRPIVPATCEQVEAIRTELIRRERPGYAAIVSVLAYVGPRPQDVFALDWDHLDDRRLRIEQKTLDDGSIVPGTKAGEDRIRVIDVPGPVLADLQEWRLASGRRSGLIFPARQGGGWTKYQRDAWRRRWFEPAAKKAGWSHPPKDLRHTCASLMVAAGRPVTEVADHLGHTLAISVANYQHLINAMQGKPVRELDVMIREARAESEEEREAL